MATELYMFQFSFVGQRDKMENTSVHGRSSISHKNHCLLLTALNRTSCYIIPSHFPSPLPSGRLQSSKRSGRSTGVGFIDWSEDTIGRHQNMFAYTPRNNLGSGNHLFVQEGGHPRGQFPLPLLFQGV